MMKKNGFTLTEILLAVMIVGIIGVALASLTTAASRESGVGRSKIMLRNNMSLAMRRLRQDVQESTRVLYKQGELSGNIASPVPLLVLGKNMDLQGNPLGASSTVVMYCFMPGTVSVTSSGASVMPAGSTDGGAIYRYAVQHFSKYSDPTGVPSCPTSGGERILSNVKYIPKSVSSYAVPWIGDTYNSKLSVGPTKKQQDKDLGSIIYLDIITELPSNPVVNDVIQEDLVLSNGFRIHE
jgi:prepilin-type N-terminal cleavage/methylation domain-containing protein